jgi:prolyl oligopeptidase PreP (S9A serine peptidase family)
MAHDYVAVYRRLAGIQAAKLLPVPGRSKGGLIGALA